MFALSNHIPFIMTIICVSTHLEKADSAKWCLNRLHLRVLGEQHVLDTRFTVIQWTVPRYVITTTKCVFCRNTEKEPRFYTYVYTHAKNSHFSMRLPSALCIWTAAFIHRWKAVILSYSLFFDSTEFLKKSHNNRKRDNR